MAVEEEESSKVCGLCSKLVDHGETLSDDMLEYLIAFLNIQVSFRNNRDIFLTFSRHDFFK